MIRRRALAACAGLAVAAAIAGPAAAQDDFGLTGDWGGLRTRLKNEGWTFQFKESWMAAGNLSGGDRHQATGAGQFQAGVTADLDKLAGISGGKVVLTFTDRHGSSLAPSVGLDTLQPILEVHGRGDIWRLTQFFYEQSLADGRLDLKLGRVNPGSDFDSFACNFENLTFCGAPPGNLVGDYWYNWPVSQWGGRLKYKLGDGAGYVEAGAYQVNPENLDDGFALTFHGGEGTLVPVEAAWTPKLGAAGLPGTYRIGAWYSSSDAPDVLLDVDGRPKSLTGAPAMTRDSRYGAYLGLRQQVTGVPDGPGVSLFLNATQADRRTSRLDRQIALGAVWQGPFAARPDDSIALGLGTTHVNDRSARADALAGDPAPDNEWVGELDYRWTGPKGISLTPNLQYIHNPGGLDRDDAVVLGVKVGVGL